MSLGRYARGVTSAAHPVRCPCLSGETYDECCGPLHRGEAEAPTAERLMRSRFSAFALGDADYLLRTWHPSTRPATLALDAGLRWYRLDILRTERGGPFDRDGIVSFRAHYKGTDVGVQEEASSFVREGRTWFYVAAV
jgi:SEC-C motif-containing protein